MNSIEFAYLPFAATKSVSKSLTPYQFAAIGLVIAIVFFAFKHYLEQREDENSLG